MFSKNCVSSLSVTSTNLEGISVFFFSRFYNVNYRYEQLFKIFRSGQKQQTTQGTARVAWTIENCAKMLKADWFKNDITHLLIKILSPLGRVGISFFSSCYHSVYNCFSYIKSWYANFSANSFKNLTNFHIYRLANFLCQIYFAKETLPM